MPKMSGEDVVPRRGVRQRHVADDRVFGVDVPQAEEQLGTLVEPAADAVEHGGRVLAHHRFERRDCRSGRGPSRRPEFARQP